MLITQNFGGNAHEACQGINLMGLSRFFVQLVSVSGTATIAVFKTDCYPDTVYLCEKLGRQPPTVEQWAKGQQS